ncbi:MAG: hypothetical protein U0133_19690 [Gemmatimonadales bacterium]
MWIYFALGVAAGIAGFSIARNFVQTRLRFVDAIRSPAAPWLAGLAAAVIAWPIALLPLITTTTTTIFGIGAGLGTASGVKALKRGE